MSYGLVQVLAQGLQNITVITVLNSNEVCKIQDLKNPGLKNPAHQVLGFIEFIVCFLNKHR